MSFRRFINRVRSLTLTGLLTAASLLPTLALSAPPPAGSLIEAQAQVAYFDETLGIYQVIPSNVVITVVKEVAELTVAEDQTIFLTPDTLGQFAFVVTNKGNVELNPVLAVGQIANDDFDPQDVTVYIDANRNGLADAGEMAFDGQPVTLGIGSDIGVLVYFKTPASLGEGLAGQVQLFARNVDPDLEASSVGTVIVSTTGMALDKEVNRATASAGDLLTYGLTLWNRGTTAVPGYDAVPSDDRISTTPILVDGVRSTGVLLRDEIPLNTQLISVDKLSESQDFDVVYRVVGLANTDHDYVSEIPSDKSFSDVDVIAFFRPGDYPVGTTSEFQFSVRVNDTVGNTIIPNEADTWQRLGSDVVATPSNPVRTRISGAPPQMDWVDNSTPANIITSTPINSTVGLIVSAAVCNDSSAVDVITVTVITTPEGDYEQVTAHETGPNTGVFVSTLLGAVSTAVIPENDQLSAGKNTVARASTICQGETITAAMIINPGGVVFNSATNQPVAGAKVYLNPLSGPEAPPVSTDEDGFYAFNSTTGGLYEIRVEAPDDKLTFPSTRTVFFGFNRTVVPGVSYGDPFDPADNFIGVDIPLDPNVETALALVKSVEADQAGPGDILTYTLTLTNRLDIAVVQTVIEDVLPDGIRYIAGTGRLDGQPIAVTTLSERLLTFDLGTLPRSGQVEVTYLAQVEPLAKGPQINRAIANGLFAGVNSPPNPAESNEARAVVQVQRDRGVFGDRAVILGTIYADFNRNGMQDTYIDAVGRDLVEPGIPGVRITFSNGASVVTDADGRYSIPGITPRTHAAAIATSTLPESVELRVTRSRDMLSPQSRLIRPLPGEIRAEYFGVVPREGVTRDQVLLELAERLELFMERAQRIGPDARAGAGGASENIDFNGNRGATRGDITRETETGIIQRQTGASGAIYTLPAEAAPRQSLVALARTRSLEADVRSASPALGFLDLRGNETVNDDVVSIRVKGPIEGRLGLELNGESIPEGRVSQRASLAESGVQAAEFVAIRLNPGVNTLVVTLSDPFGNVRQRREVVVTAPGRSAQVQVIAPPQAYADPATPIPVVVRVVDVDGLPTGVSMDMTLITRNGSDWGARDVRPSQPGLQVFVDGGEALLDYYPPNTPGTHQIQVQTGIGTFGTDIMLETNASERVLVGVVEGIIGFNEDDVDTSNLVGYDETITGLNGELYLRGRIRGGAILTLRYDSDADSVDRLFRDVDPDRFYPVYGDSSERGFDAQSNTQLYVRVEKGSSYILYGDVTMGPQADGFRLGGYSRTVTGMHAHYENEAVTVDVMAARTDQSQIVREFRAEGLSGPYEFDLGDYVEGSERVEAITRDQRQPSTIINTVQLSRYEDYRLDYFNDTIVFNTPIQATDDDGNPVFIRVTYETRTGDDPYWIYSGEVSYEINDKLTVGYRQIRSDADAVYDDRSSVQAAYADAEIGERASLEAEIARSKDNLGETGNAARIEYRYDGDQVDLMVRYGRADENFGVSGSSMSAGREEAEVTAQFSVGPDLRFDASVVYDRDIATGAERRGAELLLQERVTSSKQLSYRGGLRHLNREPGEGGEGQSVLSAVIGAQWRPEAIPDLAISGEIEADLSDFDNMRGELRFSRSLTEDLRYYGRAQWATDGAEFLDFSSGAGMTGSLSVGVEHQFTDSILTFAEARSGTQTGFVGGISGEWDVSEQVWGRFFPGDDNAQLYARAEVFQPYDVSGLLGLPFGEPLEDAKRRLTFAVGSYGEYEDGNGALRLDAEGSIDEDGYTVYGRQYWAEGYGDWTWAFENRTAYSVDDADGDRLRNHLRFGTALRPIQEKVDALALVGLRYEDDNVADFDKVVGYWTFGGSGALDANTRMTFRQAGQYQDVSQSSGDATSFLTFGQVGLEHDFGMREEFDARISGHLTAFYDVETGETSSGAGLEFGIIPSKNTAISFGYNWSDVEAAEVSEIYHEGAYLRLTLKLDNSSFGFFDRLGMTVGD